MSYLFDPADGKIHTRYSELKQCTPGQIWRVLERREEPDQLTTPSINWGRIRHELWAEESLQTGLLPACFELGDQAVQYVEQEIAGEILPGVVLHGRVDSLMNDHTTIIDYKTLRAVSLEAGRQTAYRRYSKSMQLRLYAYLLGLNGFRVRHGRFLVEIWNYDYDTILGYAQVEQAMNLRTIGPALSWAEDRVARLASAMEAVDNKATKAA